MFTIQKSVNKQKIKVMKTKLTEAQKQANKEAKRAKIKAEKRLKE
jgi:hypothetical protein